MTNYVSKALSRFHNPTPKKPQHSPHPYATPVYGPKQQYSKPKGNACLLGELTIRSDGRNIEKEITRIKNVRHANANIDSVTL